LADSSRRAVVFLIPLAACHEMSRGRKLHAISDGGNLGF
jgi:hypothetical protein